MKHIETLFKYLVLESEHVREGSWADTYQKTLDDFVGIKTQVEESENKNIRDLDDFENIMAWWISTRDNHISSRGQSILPNEKFKIAIQDDAFVTAFNTYLLEPNHANYEGIKNAWNTQIEVDNKVLYNRAAAAINSNLTCVVDESKFYTALHYLQTTGLDYPHEITYNWHEDNIQLTEWLDEELKEVSEETGKGKAVLRNILVWEIYDHNPDLFQLKKNIVKYGAPGTGKTYTCQRDTERHFKFWQSLTRPDYQGELKQHSATVQFHPSFTYEDFMEGIKPLIDADGNTQLRLTNGIFKDFCKRAAQWEMDVYRTFPERKWSTEPFENIRIRAVKGELSGERWAFLETLEDSDDKNPKYLHQYIPPFYFIIDEINRAELSRVMGELMLCLEYRGIRGKIKTQYSYLVQQGAKTEFWWEEEDGNYFFVPHNVYLLATMNTIDRSVESFDFALRRRFRWIEVAPDYDVLTEYLLKRMKKDSDADNLVKRLKTLNKGITENPLLGKDFQIGHAYLMGLSDTYYNLKIKKLKELLWDNFIQPLLEEYLRGTGMHEQTVKAFGDSFKK